MVTPINPYDGGGGRYPHQVPLGNLPAEGGVPPSFLMGVGGYPHPRSDPSSGRAGGATPNWNSIACTCYAAGGMPPAFRQENFLVMKI